MQLCGSLSFLWRCLSLGLGWKLTFSGLLATAEFSKIAGILSAALSQHHLSGLVVAHWNSSHLHELCSYWCFLRSTWVCIPGCLALGEWSHHCDYLGHEDFFLYSPSVYSCRLFLISFVRSIPFLPFIEPIFAWNVPLVSLIFLKRSLFCPILLFSSISLHWSLRKPFLSLLAILWNSAFKWVYLSFSPLLSASLLFRAILRPPQTAILLFCISFSWGWSWPLSPVLYHEPPSIVHQALCLSDVVPEIYFSLPLYNHKGFDLGHTWMV